MTNNIIQFPSSLLHDFGAADGGIECSKAHAVHYGAFVEGALDVDEARLSYAIEKRREIVEQVDAIHRLEGFSPEGAPGWFKELTEDYVLGRVTAEEATQKALALIKARLS